MQHIRVTFVCVKVQQRGSQRGGNLTITKQTPFFTCISISLCV